MSILSKLRTLLAKIGEALQSPLLLVIRLYWGWQFILTGRGKLMHLDKTARFFASLNIPAPKLNAIMAASTECTCGALLLLGLFSRFASPALMTVMCVAFATADRDAVQAIFTDPDKFLGADPFLFLFAATIVFAFGPGRLSLDALLFGGKKA
jgi:putative oxidoreductase